MTGGVEASLFFMKNDKLLHNTRKTYHKVERLITKNAIKGKDTCLFYHRLLKARKLILKWYYKNNYSLVMLNVARLDYTINYSLNNPISWNINDNIRHILTVINDFNKICEEIEEYYG